MLRRATPALLALLLPLVGCGAGDVGDGKAESSDNGAGAADGSTDGGADGAADGASDGAADGASDGAADGATDGGADGASDGGADGATDGGADGATDGGDGATDGGDGATDGGGSTVDCVVESGTAVYGPDNAWWHAPADCVPADLSGGAHRVGQTLGNFTLTDQNGDQVELYQFYGKVVQLVLVAEWNAQSVEVAPDVEAAAADLLDEDVVVLTVMVQQDDGREPDAAALARWVERFGLTHPVLAGNSAFLAMLQDGFPVLPVADSSMTIVTLDNLPFDLEYLRGVE